MHEEIIISDWKEIEALEVNFPLEVFRGQSDASWELSSSLNRFADGSDAGDDICNTEFWLLRTFRRRAKHYISDLPDSDDIIGWLSLMQHYGTPTRLIDFSHSFYVACYFALINATTDAAVWAIDPGWLLGEGHKVFGVKNTGLRDESEDRMYNEGNRFLRNALSTASQASDLSENCEVSGVIPVEPFQFNKRLGSQQGLFCLPLDISKSFEANLENYEKAEYEKFNKIIIKYEIKETVLAYLREMNITAETLFPGIEGFAKSITHKVWCR
ncbi:FRG domain-containing protein [Marinobacter hydrocarbonoclasticus]|uniref:FRG domain-containing protein n=1 Tax=Marinobacter nauticus TaxID=2743 RepID=UPI001A8E3A40|nr:FRG domain-containing protein [Marinobacter nauticus]MBN8239971.1 FRG domain-containing protein [Marinobacter nauticus]MBY5963952.1 FRG domain-containing protein [Marinobacter nauticus]